VTHSGGHPARTIRLLPTMANGAATRSFAVASVEEWTLDHLVHPVALCATELA
jgi:hypothetical protein